MIETLYEPILAPEEKVQKNSNRLDDLHTFNCQLESSEQEKTWTSQAEWGEYSDSENQKAKRTTRIDLDDELKFCPIEQRQEKITEAFEIRMQDLRKSRMLFIKPDEKGGVKYKVVRQSNRFMKDNHKNIRRKYSKLFSGHYAQGVFLTLTTWSKNFKTREQALNTIWADFHKFKKALDLRSRNKMSKEHRKNYHPLEYLAVLEFTQEGWAHLHICFVGVRNLAPKNYLKHLWYQYHKSYILKVIGFRGVSVYAYIMKYFDKFQDLPVALQGLMWYGRKRFYNTSRRFRNQVKKEAKKGYVFISCVKKEFIEQLDAIFTSFKWCGMWQLADIEAELKLIISKV